MNKPVDSVSQQTVNLILGRNVKTRVEWPKEVVLRVMAFAVSVSITNSYILYILITNLLYFSEPNLRFFNS